MSLAYGGPSVINILLRTKRPGDQITYADIEKLPNLSKSRSIRSQRRDFLAYLESHGVATRKGILFYFTGELLDEGTDVYTQGTYRQEPIAVEYGIGQQLAIRNRHHDPFLDEFFDPNDRLFRGSVAKEARTVREKHYSPEVLVAKPDGSVMTGVMTNKPTWKSMRTAKMNRADAVLVRHWYDAETRGGPLHIFEPLTSIRDYDQATLNGEPIRTVVEPRRILHLPILASDEDRNGVRNGVAYLDGRYSEEYIPAFVHGAEDKVWTILSEVRIRRRGSSNGREFIIAEIP